MKKQQKVTLFIVCNTTICGVVMAYGHFKMKLLVVYWEVFFCTYWCRHV